MVLATTTSPSEVHSSSSIFPLEVSPLFLTTLAGSKRLVDAHFKALRCFRKWCRMTPFIIDYYGFRKYTNPDKAKLQLRAYWLRMNKTRDITAIDHFVSNQYQALYQIQNGDTWGAHVLDFLAPPVSGGCSNFYRTRRSSTRTVVSRTSTKRSTAIRPSSCAISTRDTSSSHNIDKLKISQPTYISFLLHRSSRLTTRPLSLSGSTSEVQLDYAPSGP